MAVSGVIRPKAADFVPVVDPSLDPCNLRATARKIVRANLNESQTAGLRGDYNKEAMGVCVIVGPEPGRLVIVIDFPRRFCTGVVMCGLRPAGSSTFS